jgi:hypothetical protein
MFNHNLIKRSLVVGLTAAAAAFPTAAQAFHIEGGPAGVPVPVTGPQPGLNQNGHLTSPTALGPTDASSGGYSVPAPVVSTTAQPGTSFNWGDAGIGAGSAIVLLGASGLGMVATRRRRPQRTLAS